MDWYIYYFTCFPYGAVEITNPDTGVKFKVNAQRLK